MSNVLLVGGASHERIINVPDEHDHVAIDQPYWGFGFESDFYSEEVYTRRGPHVFVLRDMKDQDFEQEQERLLKVPGLAPYLKQTNGDKQP